MAARYKVIPDDGKLVIPPEIRRLEALLLEYGTPLMQAMEDDRLIFYKPEPELSRTVPPGSKLDKNCALQVRPLFLEAMNLAPGEPLYLYAQGDLVVAEKARCCKCGSTDRILEYHPHHFMCFGCVVRAIEFEEAHRN